MFESWPRLTVAASLGNPLDLDRFQSPRPNLVVQRVSFLPHGAMGHNVNRKRLQVLQMLDMPCPTGDPQVPSDSYLSHCFTSKEQDISNLPLSLINVTYECVCWLLCTSNLFAPSDPVFYLIYIVGKFLDFFPQLPMDFTPRRRVRGTF